MASIDEVYSIFRHTHIVGYESHEIPILVAFTPLFMAQSPNLLRFQQVSIDDGTHLWPNLVVQHLTEETTNDTPKKKELSWAGLLSVNAAMRCPS